MLPQTLGSGQLTRNRAAAFQSRPRTALEANSEPNWDSRHEPARVRGGQGDVPGGASCLVSLTSRRPAVPGPLRLPGNPWPRSRPLRKVGPRSTARRASGFGLSLRNHSVLDVTRYAWSPALTWSMARAIAHRSSSTENGFWQKVARVLGRATHPLWSPGDDGGSGTTRTEHGA